MDISAVDICNQALDVLGEKNFIASFDDGTAIANLCKRVYPLARNIVLEAHDWNCAISRETLAQLTETPDSGYSYQYQLPISPLCLRVLEMTNVQDAEYRIEGDRLLTDEDECSIRYIKEQTDTTKYSPKLIQLMAYKVAEMIAYNITGDRSTENAMKQTYEYHLSEAKGLDNVEGQQPDPDEKNTWIEAGRS